MAEIKVTKTDRKKAVVKAMGVFLVIILLLTFFSNTINNFTAPKVVCEKIQNGQLVKEASGTGMVKPKKIVEQFVQFEMKVLKVGVEVGDKVKKGQFILSLDTSSIERDLKNESMIYEQKKLNVQKLKEGITPAGLMSYDNNIEKAQRNLEKAQRDYENAQGLYATGGESEINVKNAKAELENAKAEVASAKNNKNSEVGNKQIELKSALLELEAEQQKLDEYSKKLNMSRVTALSDGIITELNFDEGALADSSKPMYRLADTGKGFEFVASMDEKSIHFLTVGNEAEVTVDTLEGYPLKGKITKIADNKEKKGTVKDIYLDIPQQGLTGGESGSVNFKIYGKNCTMLVSNSALAHDSDGYFVYVINEKKGPLGNELYAEKVRLILGDSDNYRTEILSGINMFDKVITSSDKTVSNGVRIVIKE